MNFDGFLEKIGRKLSDEQLAAVYSDKSTVVSAGAGSGKTTVLSLRFLRLVMEGKAHADEILTLTFTRKAAGEMYERIHGMLSLAAEDDERLSEELSSHFPLSRISTLDSFWSEIARTDSLRYGVTRDFSELDENEREDMVRTIFDEMIEEDEYRKAFLLLSAEYAQDKLYGLFSTIVRNTDILTSFTKEKNMKAFESLLSEYIKVLIDKGDTIIENLRLINEATHTKLEEEINDSIRAYEEGRYQEMSKLDLKKTRGIAELNDFVKGTYRPFLEKLKQALPIDSANPFVESFSLLVEAFITRVQSKKRSLGMLSFKDVETLAKTILIENIDVRNFYKRKFKYIMIDEFQDNNATQRDMLYLLSEKLDSALSTIPSIKDTDPEKLFFVGDDKQSIYYFRGADVSVFRALRNDISSINGAVLSLSRNYRSEPGLINHFNAVFETVFTPHESECFEEEEEALIGGFLGIDSSSFEAEHEMITSREKREGIEPRIRVAIYSDDGMRTEENAEPDEAEALYVADLVKEIVSGHDYLVSGKDGKPRRPSYSDIAILVQTTKAQMPFERAFRVHGIPYTVVESASTTLDGVASDFYSFLQLLLYPNDKLAFLTLLRSPFARISDDGLLAFADSSEPFMAFCGEVIFERKDDKVSYESLAALYHRVRALIGRASITSILDTLYYEGGYHSFLVKRPELAVYEEHFEYIWTLAESFDEKGRSFSSFLDELRPLIGSVEKMENVAIQHFSSDAVSMMTVHKSKGLEFPIVILADSTRGLGNADPNHLVCVDGLIVLEPKDSGYPIADLFSRYEKRREIAERKRVLYVALTRAMDHLVITGVQKKKGGNHSLYEFYSSASALPIERIEDRAASELYPEHKDIDRAFWYGKEEYKKGEDGSIRIGVKDSLEDKDNSFMEGETLPSLHVDGLIANKNLYTVFGTMVHAKLESLLSSRPCGNIWEKGLSDEENIELERAASDIAESFLSSSFYKEYVEGNAKEVEVRFYYPDGDMVVEGSVDLLIHYPDHLLVVDYKTDKKKIPEMHKGQIAKYAEAMEGIYRKRCLSTVLYVRDWSRSAFFDKNGDEVDC